MSVVISSLVISLASSTQVKIFCIFNYHGWSKLISTPLIWTRILWRVRCLCLSQICCTVIFSIRVAFLSMLSMWSRSCRSWALLGESGGWRSCSFGLPRLLGGSSIFTNGYCCISPHILRLRVSHHHMIMLSCGIRHFGLNLWYGLLNRCTRLLFHGVEWLLFDLSVLIIYEVCHVFRCLLSHHLHVPDKFLLLFLDLVRELCHVILHSVSESNKWVLQELLKRAKPKSISSWLIRLVFVRSIHCDLGSFERCITNDYPEQSLQVVDARVDILETKSRTALLALLLPVANRNYRQAIIAPIAVILVAAHLVARPWFISQHVTIHHRHCAGGAPFLRDVWPHRLISHQICCHLGLC